MPNCVNCGESHDAKSNFCKIKIQLRNEAKDAAEEIAPKKVINNNLNFNLPTNNVFSLNEDDFPLISNKRPKLAKRITRKRKSGQRPNRFFDEEFGKDKATQPQINMVEDINDNINHNTTSDNLQHNTSKDDTNEVIPAGSVSTVSINTPPTTSYNNNNIAEWQTNYKKQQINNGKTQLNLNQNISIKHTTTDPFESFHQSVLQDDIILEDDLEKHLHTSLSDQDEDNSN